MPDTALPDLVPARMINEMAYCPRLAFLEYIQGEFQESVDTLDGRYQHRRIAKTAGTLPKAESLPEADTRIHASSVELSAPSLGLTAVIDLIESMGPPDSVGGVLTPVEYKRGNVPDNPERSWEPERVQLCAAGLILRENGYECHSGVIYYIAAKTRVEVTFDPPLIARTLELAAQLRLLAQSGTIPPPLVDSPKCPRCSLVGICLPDEVNFLKLTVNGQTPPPSPRPIVPPGLETLPLYVQEPRAYVGKSGDTIQVRSAAPEKKVLVERPLGDISQLTLFGDVQISTQAIQSLCQHNIPVVYLSYGGWFYGMTAGLPGKNIILRQRQFQMAADRDFCLRLARAWVAGKIRNQRTLLRRNASEVSDDILADLARAVQDAENAPSIESLLGIEGSAARAYFSQFQQMLSPAAGQSGFSLQFKHRNRRPPTDPVNAILSYAYALLTKEITVACWTAGLDPHQGFFHQSKYGKPSLALDLMEEFRPIIADSVVITAVNTGVIGTNDFIERGGAVALEPTGRKAFLQAYERRMDSEITHPIFGYRVSYRRILHVQVRLLSRLLMGELSEYPAFTTR